MPSTTISLDDKRVMLPTLQAKRRQMTLPSQRRQSLRKRRPPRQPRRQLPLGLGVGDGVKAPKKRKRRRHPNQQLGHLPRRPPKRMLETKNQQKRRAVLRERIIRSHLLGNQSDPKTFRCLSHALRDLAQRPVDWPAKRRLLGSMRKSKSSLMLNTLSHWTFACIESHLMG